MPDRRYTSQSELDRRQRLVESLGRRADKPGFGGLIDAFRGGREERALSNANTANADIQSEEMQALIQSMRNNAGGGLQGPMPGGAGQPELSFQTPGLQNIQLQQALGNQNDELQHKRALELANTRGANNERWGAVQYRKDGDKTVAYQTSNFGG